MFKLHCVKDGLTRTFLYNQEHIELLDEQGSQVWFPHPISGEAEANAVEHKPIRWAENLGLSAHAKKRAVAQHHATLTDVNTPYLGDAWHNIRLFYDQGLNHTASPIREECEGCPVARFCELQESGPDCETYYWYGFAELMTAIKRLTGYTLQSIECTLHPYFLNLETVYQETAYLPLWLGVEPPVVSIDSLVDWSKSAQSVQSDVLSQMNRDGTIYDAGYDTKSDKFYISAVTHPQTGEWFAGFDKAFPELVAFFDRYPIRNKRIMAVTTLPDADGSAFYHMDWDDGILGFRFYAVKDDKQRLSFRTIKPEYAQFYAHRKGKRATVPSYHMKHGTVVAETLGGPHAWCIGNQFVAHAVEGFHEKARSVFLLYGDIDYDAYAKIYEESCRLYANVHLKMRGF